MIILNFLGAIALSIFGLKIMNDGIQKTSKIDFSKIIKYFNKNNFTAFLSGFSLTSLFHSASAVVTFILSLVNIGMINTQNAIALTLGANLGTVIFPWILLFLGFYLNPIHFVFITIAIAFPFYISKNNLLKYIARILIGLCIVLIGLQFSKNFVDIDIFFPFLYKYPLLSRIICPFISLILALLIQSSSVMIVIIMVLTYNNFPIEISTYCIIGANLAAFINILRASKSGNIYTKTIAVFNMKITLISFLTILILNFWLIDFLKAFINNDVTYVNIYNTIFNLINITIGIILFNKPIKSTSNIVFKNKTNSHLTFYTSNFSLSPDFFIYEARIEIRKYAGTVNQSIALLGRLLTTSSTERFDEFINRLKLLENQNIELKNNLTEFISKIYYLNFNSKHINQTKLLLDVCYHLENAGNLVFKTSLIHKNRRNNLCYMTPALRDKLLEIQEIITDITTILMQNLADYKDFKEIEDFRDEINTISNESLNLLYKSINNKEMKTKSAFFYRELLYNYELIVDSLYKTNSSLKNTIS